MIDHSFIDKKENKLEEEMKLNQPVQEQKIEKALLDREINDAKSVQADESFVDKLMGDNVEPRREFIEKNAKYATVDAYDVRVEK